MDFGNKNVLLFLYAISNAVAIIMLWSSWKKPTLARVLYFLLFAWASWTNGNGAVHSKEIYLGFAQLTFIPFYKDFILGFFSRHITLLILTIAACQFLIAFSMWMKDQLFKAGCWAAIIFLVGIAPLGMGSAFPSTLIMAGGLYLLARKNITRYLFQSTHKLQTS